MADKFDRQKMIEQLINADEISDQTVLLKKLKGKGMIVDQSTLSRDLTELGIHKYGGHYVGLAPRPKSRQVDLSAVVHSMSPCGPHLIVIKTAIGQAPPVAVAIDNEGDASIMGTIAGDDTIFIATKDSRQQTVALRRLHQWFGD